MTARLSPRFALWRAGAFFGILAAAGIIIFVPAGLREAGVHVAKAWGLDQWAAPLCLLGAIPGAVIADRIRTNRTSASSS